MELISVIVTIYNGEKFISECIKSICDQTYRNLEIIIVDDGSVDNTYKIIKELAKYDQRISIIKKENGGVSSARNIGFKHSNGNYVSFIDGDDVLEPDMYEILIKLLHKYNVSIAHCGYNRISSKGIKPVNNTKKVYIQSKYEAIDCLLSGKLFVGSLWNKLYKKSIFDNITFDESIKINEDILANYFAFKSQEKSVFYDVAKYNYYERKSSACFIVNDEQKTNDCIKVAKRIYEDSIGEKWENIAANRYLYMMLNEYRFNIYNKNDAIVRKKLSKKIRKFSKNIITGINIKINVVLIYYFPIFYKYLYKIYDKIRKPNWDV